MPATSWGTAILLDEPLVVWILAIKSFEPVEAGAVPANAKTPGPLNYAAQIAYDRNVTRNRAVAAGPYNDRSFVYGIAKWIQNLTGLSIQEESTRGKLESLIPVSEVHGHLQQTLKSYCELPVCNDTVASGCFISEEISWIEIFMIAVGIVVITLLTWFVIASYHTPREEDVEIVLCNAQENQSEEVRFEDKHGIIEHAFEAEVILENNMAMCARRFLTSKIQSEGGRRQYGPKAIAVRSGFMGSCNQCRRMQPTYLCADCGVHLCSHQQCINQHRCEPGEGTLAGIIYAEIAKCRIMFRACLDELKVWQCNMITKWRDLKEAVAAWTIPQSAKNGYVHISILAIAAWHHTHAIASFVQAATSLSFEAMLIVAVWIYEWVLEKIKRIQEMEFRNPNTTPKKETMRNHTLALLDQSEQSSSRSWRLVSPRGKESTVRRRLSFAGVTTTAATSLSGCCEGNPVDEEIQISMKGVILFIMVTSALAIF